MISRRAFMALAASVPATGLLSGAAHAGSPEIYAPGGIAINGYDPVAYFTDGMPVKGVDEFTYEWKGATWRFSSADNRDAFAADPVAYAPRYGGYCAYAVSKGGTASTEPDAWRVHEGRLYLNYSLRVRSIWENDIPGNIAKADVNWPGVLDK